MDERSPKKTKLNFCHIQFRYILLHQGFHLHLLHLYLVFRKKNYTFLEMFRSLFSCEMLLLEISLRSPANSHQGGSGREGSPHRKRGNLVLKSSHGSYFRRDRISSIYPSIRVCKSVTITDFHTALLLLALGGQRWTVRCQIFS